MAGIVTCISVVWVERHGLWLKSFLLDVLPPSVYGIFRSVLLTFSDTMPEDAVH